MFKFVLDKVDLMYGKVLMLRVKQLQYANSTLRPITVFIHLGHIRDQRIDVQPQWLNLALA